MGKEIEDTAEQIANIAFGDDWEKTVEYIRDLKKCTKGCGCSRCIEFYKSEVSRKAEMFVAPNRSNFRQDFEPEYKQTKISYIDEYWED